VSTERGRRALVVENDPTNDIRRLGDWLTGAGLELVVARPHAGELLPATLDDFAALVVLGGEQHAYPAWDGAPQPEWFEPLESLLRQAVQRRVPTLAICLGGQLLAAAHGGKVAPAAAGSEIGARLVARRDIAARDALFAAVPFAPDVVQWHHDEITVLPAGAVLLAASTHYAHQAFRLGPAAWGTQFHIECDTAMFADWAAVDRAALEAAGIDVEQLVAGVDRVMPDVEEVWRPFAERFAALAQGRLAMPIGTELPLLGH
jgi:GMP synthase-like glutamine amidotransferase